MVAVRRISLIVLVLLAGTVSAQSFRGDVSERILLEADTARSVTLVAGQVLLVQLDPDDARFISGISIELTTPRSVTSGVLTAHMYAGVDPPPENGMSNLAGMSLGNIAIGPAPRQELLVPISGADPDQPRPGVARLSAADPSIGAIAVQIVPGMKSVDEDALRSPVTLTVRPQVRPVGGLLVELQAEASILEQARSIVELSIDGRTITAGQIAELPPGIYRLVAQAGELLNETVNVGIEQAELRRVVLRPREPVARVRLSVPTVADVYWNGSLVQPNGIMEVAPGEHSIMIRMGDFSVSRQMTLLANDTYEVAIDLDILLNRD